MSRRNCYIFATVLAAQKSGTDITVCPCATNAIAGGGFEPPTSGLWARRATRLLYPAANSPYYTLHASVGSTVRVLDPFTVTIYNSVASKIQAPLGRKPLTPDG